MKRMKTARRAARALWQPILRWGASAYVVGPDVSDAVRSCETYHERGFAVTIGFWNEDGDDPALVASRNLETLARLEGNPLDWYPSLKLPALGFRRDLIGRLLDAHRDAGVRVHFDSLAPDAADSTLAWLVETAERQPVSLTLPSRWHRSVDDAERAIELKAPVRIVKGEWQDPSDPTRDPKRAFLELIDRLAGRAAHVSVATHDPKLATEALRRLAEAGTDHDLELLFALPLRRQLAVAGGAGARVRLYVAFGHGMPPYSVREVFTSPRRLAWVARDLVRSRLPWRRVPHHP